MRKQRRSNCTPDHCLCFRYTDSAISFLFLSEIPSFYSFSVIVHADLFQTFSETSKTDFLASQLISKCDCQLTGGRGSAIPGNSFDKTTRLNLTENFQTEQSVQLIKCDLKQETVLGKRSYLINFWIDDSPYGNMLIQYFFFFFGFNFTSLSSFFTHIETNQSVGGAKTGVPGEKPPDTPASRTWLVSHMNSCPVRGANPHR